MKLEHHAAISVIIAGALYLIFKSWGLSLASLIAGIVIDVDHIPEYIREHGRPFNISNFFNVCNRGQFEKLYLIFHSWELVVVTGIIAWMTAMNPWITGAALGLFVHLVLDTITNTGDAHFRSYFIIWRWKHGFDHHTAFGKRPGENA